LSGIDTTSPIGEKELPPWNKNPIMVKANRGPRDPSSVVSISFLIFFKINVFLIFE
jgi:hypothetical protein